VVEGGFEAFAGGFGVGRSIGSCIRSSVGFRNASARSGVARPALHEQPRHDGMDAEFHDEGWLRPAYHRAERASVSSQEVFA